MLSSFYILQYNCSHRESFPSRARSRSRSFVWKQSSSSSSLQKNDCPARPAVATFPVTTYSILAKMLQKLLLNLIEKNIGKYVRNLEMDSVRISEESQLCPAMAVSVIVHIVPYYYHSRPCRLVYHTVVLTHRLPLVSFHASMHITPQCSWIWHCITEESNCMPSS